MELSPLFLFGKASGHTDFEWVGARVPPAEISRVCEHWLRCHIDHVGDGRTVAGFQDVAGDWWFLRASAAGTDAGGRVVYGVITGRLQNASENFNPAIGVLSAFLNNLPDRTAWEQHLCLLPIARGEFPSEPGRLPGLLAARLLDDDAVLFAESPATAAAILARLGPGSLSWVAASSGTLAGGSLPPGAGMVLAGSAPDPPPLESWLADLLDDLEADLAALMALAKDAPRRQVLLRAAGDATVPGELSDAELAWLLAVPRGRAAALRAATHAQAGRLTADGALASREEVRLVAPLLDRQSPEQSRAVATILARTGDLTDFVEIFSPNQPGREEFLSPPARVLWDYLHAPDTLPEPDLDGRYEALRELDQATVLPKLPLRALGRCQRWPFVGEIFAGRLIKEGLPEEIARWLVLGTRPTAPLRQAPALAPHPSWIADLPAEPLEALGQWMVGTSDAARWWQTALAAHPDFAGVDPADLHGPWRAARGWLAVAARLRGQCPPAALLAAFARWRAGGGPLWDEPLAFAMLRTAGFTAGIFRELAGGADEDAARTALENLDWLASGGLIDPAEEIARLPVSRLAGVVNTLPPHSPARSLLDLDALGPVAAPAEPLPPLAGVALLHFLRERRFWGRWHDGIPPAIMQWLEAQTAMEPEGQIVAAARDTLAEKQLPDKTLLAIVCDSLPTLTVLRWIAVTDTLEQASIFLDARALRGRPELASWLRERLVDQGLGPLVPLPGIDVHEFQALFPILEARHMLSWLDVHPEELDAASPFGRQISGHLRADCKMSQIGLSQLPPHLAIYFRTI